MTSRQGRQLITLLRNPNTSVTLITFLDFVPHTKLSIVILETKQTLLYTVYVKTQQNKLLTKVIKQRKIKRLNKALLFC